MRDFQQGLAADGPIKLIAEIKKASPSKGVIRPDFQPLEIARAYARHGATCLSVLTDRQFFQGGLDILQAVRQHVHLPVLRKDFILDPYQVLEARVAGADAVLLIAECLDGDELSRLYHAVLDLDMAALVELYEPRNLERVLAVGRHAHRHQQSRSAHVRDRSRSHDPAAGADPGRSRGGRRKRDSHARGRAATASRPTSHAMLVGERLMAAPDIGHAVRTLLGTEKPA